MIVEQAVLLHLPNRARAPGNQERAQVSPADDTITIDVVLRFGGVPGTQEYAEVGGVDFAVAIEISWT